MRVATVTEEKVSLEASHLEDIRLASSKMTGSKRRAFQAEMALKYCSGSARCAEDVFGWSRQAVRLGLHEKRSGIVCVGHHAFCGAKLWEKKPPEVAEVLNRNGYRLRPVLKAKPQKKSPKPTPSSPTSGNMTEIAKAKPSCA